MEKAVRHHSVHVVVARDFDRKKFVERQQAKCDQLQTILERRVKANEKWSQSSDSKSHGPTVPTMNTHQHRQERANVSLEEFMQRERLKQDKIIQSKAMANAMIRHGYKNSSH